MDTSDGLRLFDAVAGGAAFAFIPLLLLSLILARPLARRFGTTSLLAAAALVSIASILAVTLGQRAVDFGAGFGRFSLTWLVDLGLWSNAFEISSGWRWNLALFVPAGFFLTLAVGRPFRVFLGLLGLSLAIEISQGIGSLGAQDPADLLANGIGAAVGASLGTLLLSVLPGSSQWGSGRATSPRFLAVGAAAVVLLGTIGWFGLGFGADGRRDDLAAELARTFAGTTSTDIASKLETTDGYNALLETTSVWPSYLGQVGETDAFEARYPVAFFGFHRCVFVRWTTEGTALRNGSGDECTVFRDRPPAD